MIPSFKVFLFEVNYGALEHDKRLIELSNLLLKDMISVIKNDPDYPSGNLTNIPIKSNYKSDDVKHIDINWEVNFGFGHGNSEDEIEAKTTSFPDIGLYVVKIYITLSGGKKNINNWFLQNINDIDSTLLHELKHILDYVDNIFDSSYYQHYKKISDTEFSKVKYVSQDQEKENWLISVIADLRNIKTKCPEITYQKAIKKSKRYDEFMSYLIPSLKNHYKTKLVYFWYSTYIDKRFQLNKGTTC